MMALVFIFDYHNPNLLRTFHSHINVPLNLATHLESIIITWAADDPFPTYKSVISVNALFIELLIAFSISFIKVSTSAHTLHLFSVFLFMLCSYRAHNAPPLLPPHLLRRAFEDVNDINIINSCHKCSSAGPLWPLTVLFYLHLH